MNKEATYLKAWMGTIFAVVILAVIAIGADYILAGRSVPESDVQTIEEPVQETEGNTDVPVVVSGAITVTGRFICLPHKDTTGPQTLECASGIAADDGFNYALDLSAVTYPAGIESARVTGHFVPAEALSTNQWQKYDMRGIIAVDSVEPL